MKNLSGLLAVLALFLCTLFSFGQTNLIQNSSWGDINPSTNLPRYFAPYGANFGAVNTVEIGMGPHNNMVTLWKGVANLNTGQGENQDGGPISAFFNPDISKSYRFTVWVKKQNSFDGKVLLGPQVYDAGTNKMVLDANGNTVAAPYCVNGDLPSLDEWYLFVGFIHESTYDLANNPTQSMVYDQFGNAVTSLSLTDFKFDPNAVRMRILNIQVQNANAADEIFFYAPTLYEINSQMPSITSILSPVSTANTVWNVDGSDLNYVDGNVGIGTGNPGAWKLAVNGNIRAKEIKVETGWADYVFADDYVLPSLEEVERHIKEKGHLINIPSAEAIESNGVQLGEMNKLLLEKIEELTLYIIQQNKDQKELETRILELENQQ
ncbi:hypothetical protein FEE95_20905 [Maribacter algarum]|uniref:LamG domain-containing protein n=1 Tax=Maribacter algarum (ex Zhang et al. 2020) TaxID=2578118 RepID=A0A5S3PDU3_9FLAO|nr:hypothetical protein [Maribacter algarum]TMM52150.1 hypothetical protein FEE95_20905 [Maribacter algarum]